MNPLSRLTGARSRRPLSGVEREGLLRRALASALFDDGAEAEDALTELVQDDSTRVELYRMLGRLVRRRGDVGRAIRIHQNLLLRADLAPAERTRALCELGQDLREGGYLDRALATFEQARERDPRNPTILRALAELLEEAGRFREALRWRKLLGRRMGLSRQERAAEEARLWEAESRRLHAEGDSQGARRALRRALQRDARRASARLLQGELEAERGRNKAALAAWMQVPASDGEASAGLYPRLGAAFASAGRVEELGPFLEARLQLDPADLGARLSLARVRAALGSLDEAVRVREEGVAAGGDPVVLQARRLRLLLEADRKEEVALALPALLDAIEARGLPGSGPDGEGTPR